MVSSTLIFLQMTPVYPFLSWHTNIFFICSTINGQVGCFRDLAIMHLAAVNTGMHDRCNMMPWTLGEIPRIAGSYGVSSLKILNIRWTSLATWKQESRSCTEVVVLFYCSHGCLLGTFGSWANLCNVLGEQFLVHVPHTGSGNGVCFLEDDRFSVWWSYFIWFTEHQNYSLISIHRHSQVEENIVWAL